MLESLWEVCREFPILTFTLLLIFFALLGKFIVTQYLLYTQVKILPRLIFTTTFMGCLCLLVLILFQIVEIGEPQLRIWLWYITLLFMTFDCIILVPNLIILKILYLNSSRRETNSCGSKLLLMAALCVNFMYLKFVAEKSQEILEIKKEVYLEMGLFSDLHVNVLIEFITHYGTWIMAVMSGYGAVWCPYAYLNSIYTEKKKLQDAKKARISEIKFILDSIVKTKYQLLFLNEKKKEVEKTLEGTTTSWSMSLLNIFKGPKDTKQQELSTINQKMDFYKQQLQTLDRAHKDNFNYYKQIIDQQKKHQISQSLLGKIFRLFSFVLCIYSVSRIILTIWNIINGRKISNDPITRSLNFIVWLGNIQNNDLYNLYSNYISFVFMGYLIISSVRSFSINMKNLFDFILRRGVIKKLDTDIIVLILSEVYGVYFLTAVVLLQNSLPKIYTVNLKKVTGEIRVLDHFTFFDSLFLICSLLSILLLYISEKIRNDKMKSLFAFKSQ